MEFDFNNLAYFQIHFERTFGTDDTQSQDVTLKPNSIVGA